MDQCVDAGGVEIVWILIHSPLVGPLTWMQVAEELRAQGREVRVPMLTDSAAAGVPYWQQHVTAVVRSLGEVPREEGVVLVAHSGAGALLPAIRQALGRPVAAYLFVDAGVPTGSMSRLDAMAAEAPEFAAELRELLRQGGRFPNWTEEDLRQVMPEAGLRQQLMAELAPRGLGFFEEPIPVFDGWPDAPGAVLQFSPAYAPAVRYARAHDWPYRKLEAEHFHMLVDPAAVTSAMIELIEEAGRTGM